MRYGPIAAKRYKKQYCKNGEWMVYPLWEIQPEAIYTIVRELKSKKALLCLLDKTWLFGMPRSIKKVSKKKIVKVKKPKNNKTGAK